MLMPSIFGEDLFDSFFEDFARPVTNRNLVRYAAPAAGMMKTDVREDENSYMLDIEVPGYKKEEVSAQLKDGYMTITAASQSEKEEKNEAGKFLRRERYSGSCSRSFYVGKEIKPEDIKAKFANGILTITVPKKQPVKQVEENHSILIDG